MNSESPFRTSSMVLTIACVLCGITAAAYCVSRFSPARSADESSDVAVNLQYLNYAEFQKNVRSSHPHSEPSFDATGRSRSIQKHDSWLRKSGPVENSGTSQAPSSRVGESSTSHNGQEFIRSTGFERSSSLPSPPEDAAPHFYAPVTVHPVTVNIDNSAIIREIARLHERLDLVTDSSQTVEVFEPAAETAVESLPPSPPVTSSLTRRFEYIVHSQKQEVAPETSCDVVQNKEVTSKAGLESPSYSVPPPATAPQSPAAPPTKSSPQRLPARVSKEHHRPRVPAPSAFVVPEQSSEEMPAAMPMLLFPERVATPKPEPAIEIIPQRPEPVFEFDDPGTTQPETELPMIVPAIESSTELMPVPAPIPNPESAVPQEVLVESMAAPPMATIERTAHCAPVSQSRHTESLVSPDHLTSCYETAKRTTNPPFMNGAPHGNLPSTELAMPAPRAQVMQVSHRVPEKNLEAPLSKGTPSEVSPHEVPRPKCRNCNAGGTTAPAYRIKAVTPPILKRLTSLIRLEATTI